MDSRIGLESFVELVVTHVDRDHLSRSALEDTIGEPAGGCPGIEHPSIGEQVGETEVIDRTLELRTGSAHESRRRAVHMNRLGRVDQSGGLRGRRAADGDSSSSDVGLRPFSGRSEPSAHEFLIESSAGTHDERRY